MLLWIITISTLLPARLKQICISAAVPPTILQHFHSLNLVAQSPPHMNFPLKLPSAIWGARLLLWSRQLQLRRRCSQSC